MVMLNAHNLLGCICESIFSLFEEYAEWISKGKTKAPVELGVKVYVLADQYGFILHHRVMEQENDVDVAVLMVEDTLAKFPEMTICIFDKGFWSPDNKKKLDKILPTVVLPKKGSCHKKKRQNKIIRNSFISGIDILQLNRILMLLKITDLINAHSEELKISGFMLLLQEWREISRR